MRREFDEADMPRISDAYEELYDLYFDDGSLLQYDAITCLEVIASKFDLDFVDQKRIINWLEDDILDAQGTNYYEPDC